MPFIFFPARTLLSGKTYCLNQVLRWKWRLHLRCHVQLLQFKRATLARLVPTVALALAESPVTGKYKYPDLEYFSCSAAPLKVKYIDLPLTNHLFNSDIANGGEEAA